MKEISTILLVAFLALQANTQCPDLALISNGGQCIGVVWLWELPEEMPDTIKSEGNTYLYIDGLGISIAEAALFTMDRQITDPLECATDVQLMTGSMSIMGETCNFNGGLLPVNLTYFSARQVKNSVVISWETSFEYKSDYFIVQRSDGFDGWTGVKSVPGRGNYDDLSLYSVVDAWPYDGTNLYRLLAVGVEGDTEVSEIIRVEFTTGAMVYPNPASGYLTIRGDFIMLDAQGRQVASGVAQQLDVSGFAPGMYIVKVGGVVHKVVIR